LGGVAEVCLAVLAGHVLQHEVEDSGQDAAEHSGRQRFWHGGLLAVKVKQLKDV
jgi:hypothetical protein